MDRERPSRSGRARPRRSASHEHALSAAEKHAALVQSRLVDDGLQQPVQRGAELWAGPEPELDQVVAVDGEIGQAMRARALALERLAETVEPLDVGDRRRRAARSRLAEIVGALVVDELERE